MLGLRMFKGSENYSFEMDESCTCQVYQSCTLYISFPLASMHNFPSMQISTQRQRRARSARLPEHIPWHRKWIISTKRGTKQCNFVYRGLWISFFSWGDKVRGVCRTQTAAPAGIRGGLRTAGWGLLQSPELPSNHTPPLTSPASVFRDVYPSLCANIMISLMRIRSPAWMANKLEARFSFTHQS